MDNWQATQELINAFDLPFSSATYTENREEIKKRLERQRQAQEQEKRFKRAVRNRIEKEKSKEQLYSSLKEKYKPFSPIWCMAVNQLEMTKHRLDILVIGSREEQEQILNERKVI